MSYLHAPNTNPIEEFRSAIANAGLPPPPHVIGDGRIHRYSDPSSSRRDNKNCWYVLYLNGRIPAGAFGDWRTGISKQWSAFSKRTLSASDLEANAQRMASIRKQQVIEQAKHQNAAAAKSRSIWAASDPAPADHPYILKKGVHPGVARQYKGALVLPIVEPLSQCIKSLQFIDQNGSKKFLRGGAKKGNVIFCSHPRNADQIIVCEGWATGMTIAKLDAKAMVIAAIDAGNLEAVAKKCRQIWPETLLKIAADDDRLTPGNPGRTRAFEAAIATNASVLMPVWPADAPASLSDFNDLDQWLKGKGGSV